MSLHMTMPSDRRSRIDNRQELAIDSADRLYVESERNRYASRAVAIVVLLNGIAAIVLLALLAQNLTTKAFADAMMVFSSGAILGLTSAFIAYLNRTIRFESPEFTTWRRPLRWLAAAATILATVCFFVGMNMARISIEDVFRSTTRSKTISPQAPQTQPIEPQPTEPQATEPAQPSAPQTEPQPPQEQPVEPQTTEPPITEPQPVEPQTTEP
jgi:ABC-type multidrug transport system fused ATPase/permease subunit